MSGRNRARSTPRAGEDPPVTPQEVALRPSPRSASVSDISSPNLAIGNQHPNINNLINNNTETPTHRPRCDTPAVAAPVIDCNAMEEEEACDLRTREESGGAEDSENEEDNLENLLITDRHLHAEDNHAATVDELECVPSSETEDTTVAKETLGASAGWMPPGPPKSWKGPKKQSGIAHPKFEDVDNPGGWSNFTFQPKFECDKSGRATACLHHALPTGATPEPLGADGKCEVNGWQFRCAGWKKNDDLPAFRSGATKDDPFPVCRNGLLDVAVLEKLGLDEGWMEEDDGAPDAPFFHQLLLPICKCSDIKDDPRTFFCTQVAQWSDLCAIGELDLGCGTGHDWLCQCQSSRVSEMGRSVDKGWCPWWKQRGHSKKVRSVA